VFERCIPHVHADLHQKCCFTYIASSTNDYFRIGQTKSTDVF